MDTDYIVEKYRRRSKLTLNRNKNIKRGISLIVLMLIVLGIGNYYYNKYQQEIYMDKSRIMNSNENLVYTYISNLEDTNRLLLRLIYDLPIEREWELGVLSGNGRSSYELVNFNYDFEAYRIDRFEVNDYLNLVQYNLEKALGKEQLSVKEKEGLAKLVEANELIQDAYYSIIRDVEYEKHREQLRYLYYYKGELFYMLTNAIAVYSDGIDQNIIEEEPRIYTDEGTEIVLTKEEMSNYGHMGYTFMLGEELPLTEVSREYEEDEGISRIGSIEYTSESMKEGEVFLVFNYGTIMYYTDDNYHGEKKHKEKLNRSEIIKVADDYIEGLKQPLLELDQVYEDEVETGKSKTQILYHLVYTIMDDNYVDHDYYVSFSIYDEGIIKGITLSQADLLLEPYVKKDSPLTLNRIKEIFPTTASIYSIIYEAGARNSYSVEFRDYGLDFLAIVDSEAVITEISVNSKY